MSIRNNSDLKEDHNKALKIAIHEFDYERAEALLHGGADVNLENGYPLMSAVSSRDLEGVKFWLSKGANPGLQDGEIFFRAIDLEFDEAVFEMLCCNHDLESYASIAFFCATKIKSTDVLDTLLTFWSEKKFNLEKHSAFVNACSNNLPVHMKKLVGSGISRQLEPPLSGAITEAVDKNYDECLNIALSHINENEETQDRLNELLVRSGENGNRKTINTLIKHGANVNYENGMALINAITWKNEEGIDALSKTNIDVFAALYNIGGPLRIQPDIAESVIDRLSEIFAETQRRNLSPDDPQALRTKEQVLVALHAYYPTLRKTIASLTEGNLLIPQANDLLANDKDLTHG